MKKVFTLLTLLLCVCSGAWASVTWKAVSTTATAAGTLVNNNDITATTVFETTLQEETKTISGESFTHYIQVRNNEYPTTSVPNGTEKEGSTSIVIATKEKGVLTLYYMRQSTAQSNNKGTYASNDGKDLRVYKQSDASVLEGTLTIDTESSNGKNGWAKKEISLERNTTYTLSAKGTTIRFYGFNFVAEGNKTATTKNDAKTNLHAYLDNAGTITDGDVDVLSFSNYPMTIEGENIQVGNTQYQFVVNSNNYTGVKFSSTKTYIVRPANGVTITDVKAYGSSNSDAEAGIESGSNSITLAKRGGKNSPVTMDPLSLTTNEDGFFYFTITGKQSIIVLDITYDMAENVDVSVSAAGYATLFYDKNLIIPTGVKAYTASIKDDEYLALTEVEDVIPANTGVILEAAEGKYNFVVTDADAPAVTDNILTGSTTATTKEALGGTVYTLGQNSDGVVGLRSYTGTTLRAYSAYSTSIPSGSGIRAFLSFSFDESTGVRSVTSRQVTGDCYYDLQGRRVAKPTKGLYIVNGKKVIIK